MTPQNPEAVIVDGHVFQLSYQLGATSRYDFCWLAGPGDYGFTVSYNSHSPMSPADIEELIRGFLDQINPDTGYID